MLKNITKIWWYWNDEREMKDALFVEWHDLWNIETHKKFQSFVSEKNCKMKLITVDKGHENK